MEKTAPLYAHFLARFVAYVIDTLILAVAGYLIGFVFGFGYASILGTARGADIVGNALAVLASWLYFAGYESSCYQATPGKRIMAIAVTDDNALRLSFGRATVRYFAKLLSWVTVCFGFVMILFTKRRQGLHDIVSHTLVIKKAR